ncbi:MAG: hypothetical protein KAZ76_00980, partial [Fusicatenibacter sp.]|nr:hypothetical protein [Fusicatenibacter sp.]
QQPVPGVIKDIWKREQQICAAHAILRRARADLLIFYMFLQYSEKNTAWGIDESYHRCYSFTKIKKDVEVFRKCAESLWKFNFRKVHDRRSKTFRCWFSS